MNEQLIGAWTLVSLAVGEGAAKVEPFGSNPNGRMFMDGSRFAIVITRAALPKIAAGNREKATPEEGQAIVHGSIGYFGTYRFDAATRILTARIEGSTFPNFVGQEQKRLITIEGDELTYANPLPSGGGGTAKARWTRAT